MLTLDNTAADLLFREAHTANSFAPDPGSGAQIEESWDLVRWATTGGNTNPGRLLLVRSPEARERLVAHMNESNRAKTLAAPVTVVTAADTRFHELLGTLTPDRPDAGERRRGD